MANTTNFGWETPDDTDLVKDGAAAMRTLGNAIDASLVDLKGGTTGQVLSKNTNTDMDFTWVTPNDADAIQNSIVDAKGDLISATADNTPARLASSGINGQVLTIDTSTSTGLKWASVAAGGKVLQVVSATYSTPTTITSTSMTDTGLSASITPSSASSKVLVLVTHPSTFTNRNNLNTGFGMELRRNSTTAYSLDNTGYNTLLISITQGLGATKQVESYSTASFSFLDSPATTSAITYKTRARLWTTADSNSVQFQSENVSSSIILMEIGA